MPLVEVEGEPALLFTKRARGISQGGQVSHCQSWLVYCSLQVSFPGGRSDAEDGGDLVCTV